MVGCENRQDRRLEGLGIFGVVNCEIVLAFRLKRLPWGRTGVGFLDVTWNLRVIKSVCGWNQLMDLIGSNAFFFSIFRRFEDDKIRSIILSSSMKGNEMSLIIEICK